jgi:hypothetical protein
MPEESIPKDPGAVWRSQPEERLPVNAEELLNRRTWQLYSVTRSEILASIAAALLFLALLAWRLPYGGRRLSYVALALVLAWVLASVYWFRRGIWSSDAGRRDALAATGLQHYRRQLERRRDHLRNVWVWHGPLVLACLVFGVSAMDGSLPSHGLRNAIPLVVLLAGWTVFGIWRRLREANEIQREIDEIASSSTAPGR